MATLRVPSLRFHKPRKTYCVDVPLPDQPARRIYLLTADQPLATERYNYVIAEWLKLGRRSVPACPWAETTATVSAGPLFVGLATVAADFLRHCRHKLRTSPGRFKDDFAVRISMRMLRDSFPHRQASSFAARDFEKLQQLMVSKGLSISTIRRRLRYVRLALYEGAKNGHLPASIVHEVQLAERIRVTTPGVKRPTPREPVEAELVERTLPHCSPTVAAMIRVLSVTAMRPSELFNMRAIDLDMSGEVWRYTPSRHKNSHRGKSRVILLGPKAQEQIKPRLSGRRVDGLIFTPADSYRESRDARNALRKTPANEGNVVGSNRKANPKRRPGEQWDASSLSHAIRRATARAGVPTWTSYQLRHSALTAFRRAGGLETAAVVGGHSSAELTDAVYARRDETAATKVVAQIG